jgi:hypothetical protein
MRAPGAAATAAAAAAAIPAALALLLSADRAWAQGDCQAAFAKWAQQSNVLVRPVPEGSARGACIPSEAARRSLLDALSRTRGLCSDSSDDSLQPTRTLISINQTFISSLSICRGAVTAERPEKVEKDDDGGGWGIKTEKAPLPKVAAPLARSPEKAVKDDDGGGWGVKTEKAPLPKVAAPLPPPTSPPPSLAPPVTSGPRPSIISPKPVVVAPPVAQPKVERGGGAPKPPCLEAAAVSGDLHSFINRRCKGHTVLAVIETRSSSGETTCRGYSVGSGVNLKGASPPRISYECVANAGGCSRERLGDMFPECDW